MKNLKLPSGVLVVFLLLLMFSLPGQSAYADNGPPKISAEAAALIDVASGRILYEKNGDKKMRIASLTKTMTAIVAIESGNLQDVVTIPDQAVGVEGSSIYLKRGEHLTLEELLYGLMLRSGNDAAVAIANHIGGSLPGFVYLMNEKAAMIGMTRTNFTNPHGLDDSNMHYSTAVDMVKLSRYALQNPKFQEIVSTKVKNISMEGEQWGRRLQNKNRMLTLYRGADGVKTGYTKLAKRCLASSATRDGRQLAVITLNDGNDWQDSMALMDWGFANFQPVKVVKDGETIEPDVTLDKKEPNLVFVTKNEFTYPLRQEELSQVHSKVYLFDRVLDSKKVGKHAGFLHLYMDDQLIGKVPLIVQASEQALQSSSAPAHDLGRRPFLQLVWQIMAGGMFYA